MLCIKEKEKGTAAYGFQQDGNSEGIMLHKMKIFPHKQLEILYHGLETTCILATMHGQQLENFQEFG